MATTNRVHSTTLNYKVVNTDPMPYKDRNWDVDTFIRFGSDNLFPQALALFARTSPNHRGVINGKMNYLPGKAIEAPEGFEDIQTNFIDKVNPKGESLMDVMTKLMLDDQFSGNMWVEIITDRKSYLWLNHLDYTKCRKDKERKNVIIHPDWANFTSHEDKKKVLPLYPEWKSETKAGVKWYRSVLHIASYEPEFIDYGIPSWIAGQDSVKIDLKTNKWNLSRLENGFAIDGILFVPVADEIEGSKVIKRIKTEHRGEGKQGGVMIATTSRGMGNEKVEKPELVQMKETTDGSWTQLHTQSLQDIIVSHSWFRSLTSLADNTGFDTQRILNEYQVAYASVIKPYQERMRKILKKLWLEVVGREIDLEWKNEPPVKDNNFKYIWEIRKSRGLDYNEADPLQQGLYIDGTIHNTSTGDKQGV